MSTTPTPSFVLHPREGDIDPEQEAGIASLSFDDINEAARNNSGRRAWYATLLAVRSKELRDAERDAKATRSAVSTKVRDSLSVGKREPTETNIRQYVDRDETVAAAEEALSALQLDCDLLRGIVAALDSRERMIQTLSSNLRGGA